VRSSSLRLAIRLAVAVLVAGASPLHAAAVGGSSTVCTGTVSGTYSPALLPVPARDPVTLTLSSTTLSCEGPATHSLTLTAGGSDPAGASCAGPLAFTGNGSISTDTTLQTAVAWAAAGTVSVQAWAFGDITHTPPTALATGVAAVTDTGEVTGCPPSGSVSTVTFTTVLVLAG
jgi:hypothetical protein